MKKNLDRQQSAQDSHYGQRRPNNSAELIFPPFADPTWPYISLPTLKGYLKKRRISATVRDFNVEGLYYLTEDETIEEMQGRLHKRFTDLNQHDKLPFAEQLEVQTHSGSLESVP